MNKEEFKNYLIWLIKIKSEAMLLLLSEPNYINSISINRYQKDTLFGCPDYEMIVGFNRITDQYQEPSFEISFLDVDNYEETNLDNFFVNIPASHNPKLFLHEIVRLRDGNILDFGIVEEQIFFDGDGYLCRVPYAEDGIILSYDLVSQRMFNGTRLKAMEKCNHMMMHRHSKDDYIPFTMNQELKTGLEELIERLGQNPKTKTHKKRVQNFLKLCIKPVGTLKVTPMAKIIEKAQQTY